MSITLFITITIFISGIVLSLIGIIFNTMQSKIKVIDKNNIKLSIIMSEIKTDIKWIKDKLKKI